MRQTNIKRARRLLLSRLGRLSAVTLTLALTAHAQTDQILPPTGGGGGDQFVTRCPPGQMLTGFLLLTGDDVDAIRPLCAVAHGPGEASPDNFARPFHGGTGGDKKSLPCPDHAPFVTGMYVRAEGVDTIIVNNIRLWCGMAAPTQQPGEYPAAVFDGPDHPNLYGAGLIFGPARAKTRESLQHCPAGLVAVGIHGRSGVWLDSLGLICGAPKITPKGGGGVLFGKGGIKTTTTSAGKHRGATTPQAGATRRPVGETAREDSARNSPAAPKLEAPGRDGSAKTPPLDAAQLEELAARGEIVANQDQLSTELRDGQPDDPARRGFDIGMAAAEGQTAPGPGKQRVRESLGRAEQSAFDTAVAFSLERNRNAERAAKGAAIAAQDPAVAAARMAEDDAFYRLGFDIATAIFGDPALGAQGNTRTGPGSLGLRDALSPAGQRGFNAAVKFHLGRDYQ